MQFYQACYGKPNENNWTSFNLSSNISSYALDLNEKISSKNIKAIPLFSKTLDENGEHIAITEFISENGYVDVLKTKFGFTDVKDRDTLFAHGFIFTQDALDDPNNIVTIADSNFKFDFDATKSIPENLIRTEPYTLDSAMAQCGITWDILTEIMKYIFISVDSEYNYPIYIVSSNKDKVMKPLMYCIYSILPKCMRNIFSFSNEITLQDYAGKSIMFVKKENEGFYYNLDNNSTNMPVNIFDNNPQRYKLVTALKKGYHEYVNYLEQLGDIFKFLEIGDKITYQDIVIASMINDAQNSYMNMDQEELTFLIYDLLYSSPLGNEKLDDFIATIISYQVSKYHIVNDAVMRLLLKRIENTKSKKCIEAYNSVKIGELLESGEEKVYEYMLSLYKKDTKEFCDWTVDFRKVDGDSKVGKFCLELLNNAESFADIEKLSVVNKQIISNEDFLKHLKSKAIKITLTNIYSQMNRQNITHNIDDYLNLMETISVDRIDLKEETKEIKSLFWKYFNIDSFDLNEVCVNNCKYLFSNLIFDNKIALVKELADLFNRLDESNSFRGLDLLAENARTQMEKILKALSKLQLDDKTNILIIHKVQRYVLIKFRTYDTENLAFWVYVSTYGIDYTRENPFEFFFRSNITIFCDENTFKSIFSSRNIEETCKYCFSKLFASNEWMEQFKSNTQIYNLLSKRKEYFISVLDVKKNNKNQNKTNKADKDFANNMKAKTAYDNQDRPQRNMENNPSLLSKNNEHNYKNTNGNSHSPYADQTKPNRNKHNKNNGNIQFNSNACQNERPGQFHPGLDAEESKSGVKKIFGKFSNLFKK